MKINDKLASNKTNKRYVKLNKINMNNDDKKQFLALIKGEDISEIMSLLAEFTQDVKAFTLDQQVDSGLHNANAHVRNIRL